MVSKRNPEPSNFSRNASTSRINSTGVSPGEAQTIEVLAHASYVGKYYLPQIAVEPMYDATVNARTKGQWIEVVRAGAR